MIVSQMIALEVLVGSGPPAATSEQEDVVYRRMRNVDDTPDTYWRNPVDTEQMP